MLYLWGGFIGGQLVRDFIEHGISVRAVDRKQLKDWYYRSPEAENIVADLQDKSSCHRVGEGIEQVYNLAGDLDFPNESSSVKLLIFAPIEGWLARLGLGTAAGRKRPPRLAERSRSPR